jgi:hypothetical protein
MRNFLRIRPFLALRRRGSFVAPLLEQLETRIVFALPATPLHFTAAGTAHAAAALIAPNSFQLYQVHLQVGEVVTAAVSSQASGGALQSNLRIFDASGRPLALDAQQGGDARLTFQAPTAGDYLVGVSSAGNDLYDPSVADSGRGGNTTGLYSLDLQRQTAALTPDLAGASFQLQSDAATYGDTVVGRFMVDNRGGAAAGAFDVQVLLSADNLFGPCSQVLTMFELASLGAGQESAPYIFTVELPDLAQATALGLPASGPVYMGLRIDPAGVVPELNPYDQSGVHAGEDWQALTVVTPFTANGSNHTPASAQVLDDPNSRVSGVLAAGQTDWYQLKVPANVQLTATVAASFGSTLAPLLTLARPDGQVLIQSASGSLVQHLPGGNYLVSVSTLSGAGPYQLTLEAVRSTAALQPISVAESIGGIAVADLTGDGKPDLVTADPNYTNGTSYRGGVRVLLGLGDGTFAPPQTFYGGPNPTSVVVADVNGDGKPDLVVLNSPWHNSKTDTYYCGNVSVLLGKGDGTFECPQSFDVGYNPLSVVVADINGDGTPDLIVDNEGKYNPYTHTFCNAGIAVLQGCGNGTFGPPQTVAGSSYTSMAVADLAGDGKPDLILINPGTYNSATHNYTNAGVDVLVGNGDGTFQKPQFYPIGNTSLGPVIVADLTGDGKPDLLVVNRGTYNSTTYARDNQGVSVLLGTGDGTFQNAKTSIVHGGFVYSMTVADLNGDGRLDLVASDGSGGQVGVMLGNGDGTFQAPQSSLVFADGMKSASGMLAVADLTGDGKPDIIATDGYGGHVSVLSGNGDGTFQTPQARRAIATGVSYPSVTTADVTGDGKLDLLLANPYSSSSPVSLLLGNGDGTFQTAQTLPGVSGSVTVADLNGDGKPDLIDSKGHVFLGNGDGTFRKLKTRIDLSDDAVVNAVVDVLGDGKPPDIITSSYDYYDHSATVSVLLGKGDGTFRTAQTIATFNYVYSGLTIREADVAGDGKPDLVVSYKNSSSGYSHAIEVLLNNGDGTFQPGQSVSGYISLAAVADVTGDGNADLVLANLGQDGIPTGFSVMLGNGNGTFQAAGATTSASFSSSWSSYDVFVADVSGDGKPSLIVGSPDYGNGGSSGIQVLLGNGDGTFQSPQQILNGAYPWVAAVAKLTGDGRPDLITEGPGGGLRVLLGNADGSFTPAPPILTASPPNIPYLADLTGDGVPDSVILNSAGAILFRKELPGAEDSFAPPITLNPGPTASALPSRPARDLTVLQTDEGMAIATADANPVSTNHETGQSVYTVSLYRIAEDGTVLRSTAFTTYRRPTRILAADLTGDGRDDIIVANAPNDSIQIAFQKPDGTFSTPITLPTGDVPSDITVADFNGDGLPDIAVSDQSSGDVSVFLNDPQHSFTQSYRFRAGTGLYGLGSSGHTPVVSSLEQSVSLASGNFTGSGANDLVVVNRGSDSLSVLANDGLGGFANPQPVLTTSSSDGTKINSQAGQVVAGNFNGPDKPIDLAVLMQGLGQVWIYTGNGDGTFRHTFSIDVSAQATGLNLYFNPQTGNEDLLVGDSFGDVLHLQGKGDGTLQIAGRRTSLSVEELGNGHADILLANQQSDSITIRSLESGNSTLTPVATLDDGKGSTLAPGAVQWAKLDKNSPYEDAIVVASGGNAVLDYRCTGVNASGNPTFAAPVSYPVGTDPVSVTVQDINGDGIPDLIVANYGSNSVSIVFGSWNASGNWVGEAGPLLNSGGSGPIAAHAFFPNSGVLPDSVVANAQSVLPDLVVANGQSGTFAVLPGVGQGFFNDQNPQIINLPGNPVITQGPSLFGSTDSGVLLTATSQLIGFNFDDLSDSIETDFTPPSGEQIVADQALANGQVVALLSSGAVEGLAPAAGGGLTPFSISVPLTGVSSQPSALAVLQENSGIRVLVTGAGEDQVFTFSIPEPSEGLLPPEEPTGPVVEVTPLLGEPLTVVATLTADFGSPTTLIGNLAAVEAAEAVEAELLTFGLTAQGAGTPAFALGLLTHLLTAEPTEDLEGEEVVVLDMKPEVAAKTPSPTPDGLDLDRLLRELDLYQPTPSPDRPVPFSGQPRERRDQELIARTAPAIDSERALADLAAALDDGGTPLRWIDLAEVVKAMVADLAAGPIQVVSSAMRESALSSWDGERWYLLGLAGLALWPWPGHHSKSDSEPLASDIQEALLFIRPTGKRRGRDSAHP